MARAKTLPRPGAGRSPTAPGAPEWSPPPQETGPPAENGARSALLF